MFNVTEQVVMKIVSGLAKTKLLRTPDEYQMYYCLFCDGPETVFEQGEHGFKHAPDCIVMLAKELADSEPLFYSSLLL